MNWKLHFSQFRHLTFDSEVKNAGRRAFLFPLDRCRDGMRGRCGLGLILCR
jgi:hypothetical protein